jgi:hypothetical protein
MWLRKHLSTILRHPGPTLVSAPALFGTYHLLAALKDDDASTFVWVELTTSDRNDPVAQGNRLAEAVKNALGQPLYESSLPYDYGLKVLRTHLDLLGPFTFVVSNADYAPQFSVDLLELHRSSSRVVLAGASPADVFKLPEDTQVITGADLRLTLEDAKAFTGYLPDADVPALLKSSNGAYELFLEKINEYLSLPLPTRPSPEGPRLAGNNEVEVEPSILLKVLIKQEKWTEALELACAVLPDRVPALLGEAGFVYYEKGLLKRLWELTEELPETIQKDERVLFWRLASSWWLGEAEKVREDVEDRLAKYDAPELRAMYAGTLAPAEVAEAEAKRAYNDKKTSFTTFQYGQLNSDLMEGLEILRESVKLAERSKNRVHITRNASELTRQLLMTGHYYEAVHWGEWGLQKFDEYNFVNSQRKLILTNEWAVARILIGETIGLKERLTETEKQFENVLPHIIRNLTEILGDYYLSQSNPSEALTYYLKNLDFESRDEAGYNALSVVQAYIHLNEPSKALEYATRAYMLVKGEHWQIRHTSELAYGIALSIIEPRVGLNQLQHVEQEAKKNYFSGLLRAQLALYLAWVQLQLGNKKAAQQTLRANYKFLKELSETGLTLLSGPKHLFKEVWELIGSEHKPAELELRFLGQQEVWYQGKQIKLSPQMQEMLAILAFNPDGLGLEKLLFLISGDEGNLSSFRVMLTKLRQQVPITNLPYKIGTTYQADFLQVSQLLEQGKLRRALELYKGPLLPDSEAPGVVEARESLEEAMREAIIASNDPEALYSFANQLPDDLEVWEALGDALPKEDTRIPIIETRVRRIRESWGAEK